MGQKSTRATLEQVAAELNLIELGEVPGEGRKASNWWERLLPGAQPEQGEGEEHVSPSVPEELVPESE